MATKILTRKTVAAAILALALIGGAATWAQAGTCTTSCYGHTCTTTCY